MSSPQSPNDPQQPQPPQYPSYAPPAYPPQQPAYPSQPAYPPQGQPYPQYAQPGYPQQPAYPSQPLMQPGYPQQPMMQQRPSTPVEPFSVNTADITAPENRFYLVAAGGALLVLIAFFLPFSTRTTDVGGGSFLGQTISGTPENTTYTGFGLGGLLTLGFLCALVGLAAAAVGALSMRGIPGLTPKILAGTLLGAGAATLLCMLVGIAEATASGSYSILGVSTNPYTSSPNVGLWIAILAAAAMTVGGVLQFNKTRQ